MGINDFGNIRFTDAARDAVTTARLLQCCALHVSAPLSGWEQIGGYLIDPGVPARGAFCIVTGRGETLVFLASEYYFLPPELVTSWGASRVEGRYVCLLPIGNGSSSAAARGGRSSKRAGATESAPATLKSMALQADGRQHRATNR